MSKERKNYKVDKKKREVIVYNDSIDDEEFKKIERFRLANYKITIKDTETPTRTGSVNKEDLKIYLKGNIDKNIYDELVKKLDSNENYFKTRAWLKSELQKKEGKAYIPVSSMVKIEKELEKDRIKVNENNFKSKKEQEGKVE